MLHDRGLTPEAFDDFLVFMTTMNDAKKWGRESGITMAMEILKRIKPGHCIIVGPGNAAIWEITDANWDDTANK